MLGDLMGIKKTTTPSRSPSPSPTPIEPPEISLKRNSTHNVKKNVLKIDTPSIEPIAEEPIHVEPEVEEGVHKEPCGEPSVGNSAIC
jgi:hypothetical protein